VRVGNKKPKTSFRSSGIQKPKTGFNSSKNRSLVSFCHLQTINFQISHFPSLVHTFRTPRRQIAWPLRLRREFIEDKHCARRRRSAVCGKCWTKTPLASEPYSRKVGKRLAHTGRDGQKSLTGRCVSCIKTSYYSPYHLQTINYQPLIHLLSPGFSTYYQKRGRWGFDDNHKL
jgi:hypothetical protein